MLDGPPTEQSINLLVYTALTLGFVHTLLGPDHYLPFIVMARARKWSRIKTAWITLLCGVGHVGGSVVLGLVGIAFGVGLANLETIESHRGDLAAWGLLSFGLVYLVWGLRRAWRKKPHTHFHDHDPGVVHSHEHAHTRSHTHVHAKGAGARELTPWILFTVFVFGPCEPLIPLLMYPAATRNTSGLVLVTGAFALATIGTMLGVVTLANAKFRGLSIKPLERWGHALAGGTVFLCGVAIIFGL